MEGIRRKRNAKKGSGFLRKGKKFREWGQRSRGRQGEKKDFKRKNITTMKKKGQSKNRKGPLQGWGGSSRKPKRPDSLTGKRL